MWATILVKFTDRKFNARARCHRKIPPLSSNDSDSAQESRPDDESLRSLLPFLASAATFAIESAWKSIFSFLDRKDRGGGKERFNNNIKFHRILQFYYSRNNKIMKDSVYLED